jgi:hypothetical protein
MRGTYSDPISAEEDGGRFQRGRMAMMTMGADCRLQTQEERLAGGFP